ncbi:hypothetical protein BOM_1098 (plasmid) [Borrelia miyamotoi FR64b]|uniref:Uncharacterized protein n=1 Tax=Borrelia miyamotoi FR64b TaxID=1292392 RepID=W5SKL2_9SPIR|nr:hypothetical protein BOM_1098 [Borrelia miyamotoi FR64b]
MFFFFYFYYSSLKLINYFVMYRNKEAHNNE